MYPAVQCSMKELYHATATTCSTPWHMMHCYRPVHGRQAAIQKPMGQQSHKTGRHTLRRPHHVARPSPVLMYASKCPGVHKTSTSSSSTEEAPHYPQLRGIAANTQKWLGQHAASVHADCVVHGLHAPLCCCELRHVRMWNVNGCRLASCGSPIREDNRRILEERWPRGWPGHGSAAGTRLPMCRGKPRARCQGCCGCFMACTPH